MRQTFLRLSNIMILLIRVIYMGPQSPTVTFYLSAEGQVYQLNESDITQEINRFNPLSGSSLSSPAVANGYVYIGDDNEIYTN